MQTFISPLLHHVGLAAPLFLLALLGYGLMRWGHWPRSISEGLTHFVFSLALPAMLFHMMCDFSKYTAVDARLLIAFFGSCLIVFMVGRLIAAKIFKIDNISGSIFALGGIFSNNAMLGLPMAKVALGKAALPSVALVLVFNSLILWTLVTASVEWARHGSLSVLGFIKMAQSVITNPIVAAILAGTLFSLTGLSLPTMIESPLEMIGQSAAPLSLIALGMGLAEYSIREGWQQSLAICTLKLLVQPFVVWLLAYILGLPAIETQAVVLLASMAVGANVYLMSRQFNALEGPAASSLVLSTLFAALTTPIILTLIGVRPV